MKFKIKISTLFILVNIFFATQVVFANYAKWNGVWTYPSRYNSSTLEISKQTAKQFEFKLFAMNGANMGEISGVAKIVGNKAYFDDKLSKEKDAEKYGCKVTFTHKGNSIDVKTTNDCSNYAGNAVYFDKEYKKGKKLPYIEQDFVQREVFPNAKIDAAFRKLTGKDYETFLNSFHLIFEEEDLDKLNTKVFAGCVRGVCPWNTGIIMFDNKGMFYAMVFGAAEGAPEDSDEMSARFYTNNPYYVANLPKTIKKWFDEKVSSGDKIPIIYKNKPKVK